MYSRAQQDRDNQTGKSDADADPSENQLRADLAESNEHLGDVCAAFGRDCVILGVHNLRQPTFASMAVPARSVSRFPEPSAELVVCRP